MADVFISYKREEISRARLVSEALIAEGFSTFFDLGESGINAGEYWDRRLEAELNNALCCVVLWTRLSVGSDNVRSEARKAAARGALVPVLIEPCEIPIGLDTIQSADLRGWTGDRSNAQWRYFVDRGVSGKCLRASSPQSHAPEKAPDLKRRGVVFGAAAAGIALTGTAVAGYNYWRGQVEKVARAAQPPESKRVEPQLFKEFKAPDRPLSSAQFSPGGDQLLTASQGRAVQLWDAATAVELFKIEGEVPGYVPSGVFSNDGARLVFGFGFRRARLFDTSRLSIVVEFDTDLHSSGARFSEDSSVFVLLGEGPTVTLINSEWGNTGTRLTGHAGRVNSIAFSPSKQFLVTGSDDASGIVWEMETGRRLQDLRGHTGPVRGVSVNKNSTRIVTQAGDATCRLWDLAGRQIAGWPGVNVGSYAYFADNGRFIVVHEGVEGDYKTVVRSAEDGARIGEFKGISAQIAGGPFAGNDDLLVTKSLNGKQLDVYEVSSGQIVRSLTGHSALIETAAISSDGVTIATGSVDNTARIWDVRGGPGKILMHGNWVRQVSFNTSGSQLATASDVGRVWALA